MSIWDGLNPKVLLFCAHASHVRLFVTPCAVAHQAPLAMGFPRQEYWSGLPFPPPGDLLDPEIKPESPALWADSLPTEKFSSGFKKNPHFIVKDFSLLWKNILCKLTWDPI